MNRDRDLVLIKNFFLKCNAEECELDQITSWYYFILFFFSECPHVTSADC